MADLIGQKLGQYEIISLLGEGGMASVYSARQESVDRNVALKVIRPNLSGASNFIERFKREAKTIASLSHPHILKVFDYGQHEDIVYLVMEQMTGGSLTDLIQKGPLSIEMASRMLEQIAAALDYAHRRGIVHRDLKPQNVLLDEDQNAFLTDFGIAKLLDTATGFTQTGAVMGTPSYMSPEQWKGGAVDSRADIYSLGVMLFEMLSGQVPFIADTTVSMMHKHIYELPPLVRSARPELSPWVDEVLLTALAKEPSDRFGSGAALVTAFKDALNNKGPDGGFITVSENPPPLQTGEMRRMPMTTQIPTPNAQGGNNRNLLIGGAIAAAAVVLIGGYLFVQNGNTANTNATSTAIALNVISTATSAANASATVAAIENSTKAAIVAVTETQFAHDNATTTAQVMAFKTASAGLTQTALVTPTFTNTPTATPTSTPTATFTPTSTPTSTETPKPTDGGSNSAISSENKNLIAYLGKVDGRPQLFTARRDGTSPSPLTSTRDLYQPPITWSPDRTMVAFTVRTNISKSIFIYDFSSGSPIRFDSGSYPQWSPDGKLIAYIGNGRDPAQEFLYVRPADGLLNSRILTNIPVKSLAWSPDSRRIAFIAGGLWVVDPNSSTPPIKINPNDTEVSDISWSPDGTQLVVASKGQMYIINANGANRKDFLPGFNPAWSPDGDYIAYTTNPTGGTVILVKTDGTTPEQIGTGSDPSFSPDGTLLAFSTTDGKIIISDIEGNSNDITINGSSPSWAPGD